MEKGVLMKKQFLCICLVCLLLVGGLQVRGQEKASITMQSDLTGGATFDADIPAVSAILMEAETGRILFEKNADQALPPASVTKVMTMLLVMEAIDSGRLAMTDMVTASEYATSMGGSQVFLKAGETMSVLDMLKSLVIASANDCAVALAEHICGSEEAFVAKMNARAKELGMENTRFENTNGLDDDTVNHVTSARDIAIMSRELICKHPSILEISSIWMDTIRDGAFGLTNTNRLVRFYPGANGLKTGSTAKAKFCISACAKRDGMQLIAVIMASPTRDDRNETAKRLFDFGFANYSYQKWEAGTLEPIRVTGGVANQCSLLYGETDIVLEKGQEAAIVREVLLPEKISAPVKAGDVVGSIRYTHNGTVLRELPILAGEDVPRIGYFALLYRMLSAFFLAKC